MRIGTDATIVMAARIDSGVIIVAVSLAAVDDKFGLALEFTVEDINRISSNWSVLSSCLDEAKMNVSNHVFH
ncbi:hypothetical protein D3C78_1520770 [compost metagenome]